jgi:hypothetical protein
MIEKESYVLLSSGNKKINTIFGNEEFVSYLPKTKELISSFGSASWEVACPRLTVKVTLSSNYSLICDYEQKFYVTYGDYGSFLKPIREIRVSDSLLIIEEKPESFYYGGLESLYDDSYCTDDNNRVVRPSTISSIEEFDSVDYTMFSIYPGHGKAYFANNILIG